MKTFRTIICAALLVAGLCGCEKDDVELICWRASGIRFILKEWPRMVS